MRPFESLPAARGFRRLTTVGRKTLPVLAFLFLVASANPASAEDWRDMLEAVLRGESKEKKDENGDRDSETQERDEVVTDRLNNPGSPDRTASESERRSVAQYLRYLGYLRDGQSDADFERAIAAFCDAQELPTVSLSIEVLLERLKGAFREREAERWAQAETADSTEAYQSYMEVHQGFAGVRNALAKQRIAAISEGEARRRQEEAKRLEMERLRNEVAAAKAAAQTARLERQRAEIESDMARRERGRRDRRARRRRQTVRLTADPNRDYPDKCRSGYIVKRELFTTSGVTHPFREFRRSGPGQRCRIEVRFSGRKFALNYRQCWADGDCAWVDESPWSVGNSTHGAAHLGCGYGAYYGTMPSSESVYICWFKD